MALVVAAHYIRILEFGQYRTHLAVKGGFWIRMTQINQFQLQLSLLVF